MMRDVILKLSLPVEKAAAFESANAMVTPLTDAEVAELREAIIGVDDFLSPVVAFAMSLARSAEALDGEDAEQVRKGAAELAEAARLAAARQDRTRELLGRAVFVGSDDGRVLN